MRLLASLWRAFHRPDYEVWLTDPWGRRMQFVGKVIATSVTRVLHGVGRAVVDIETEMSTSLDGGIEIWRSIRWSPSNMLAFGAIRDLYRTTYSTGQEVLRVAGPDRMTLLDARIVDYHAGSPQASKSGPADDVMKEIVRENLGINASAERNLSNMKFTVQSDQGLGPNVQIGFSYQNVLRVLQDIHNKSINEGSPIYFDVVPVHYADDTVGFEFQTFPLLRGSEKPVVISPTRGNVEKIERSMERSVEVTRVIAGGQGEGADRVKKYANDEARQVDSPWNLREMFVDARDLDDEDKVQTRADEGLAAGRPRERVTIDLLDSPSARFLRDWDIGDRVEVETKTWQGAADIVGYRVQLDRDGIETLRVRAEVESGAI